MLITGQRSISTLLRTIIDVILAINLAALILLPLWLQTLYNNPDLIAQLDRQAYRSAPDITAQAEYPEDFPSSSYPFYLGFLYAAGFGTAWILLEGHFILRRLEKNQPFAERQSGSFIRVSSAFVWLALVFAAKIAFYNTVMTMFCCGLFIMLALVGRIMAEIFRQAYLVKSENELTI